MVEKKRLLKLLRQCYRALLQSLGSAVAIVFHGVCWHACCLEQCGPNCACMTCVAGVCADVLDELRSISIVTVFSYLNNSQVLGHDPPGHR